jgi:hypothetical protein
MGVKPRQSLQKSHNTMIVEENIVIRTVARRCDPLPTLAKIFFKKIRIGQNMNWIGRRRTKISECGTDLKVIVIAKIWRNLRKYSRKI